MGSQQRAVCPENDGLVDFMRKWWIEMAEKKPKYYTDNTEMNIQRAFSNVCQCKAPIKTLKDFQKIKGVGNWFVKHMRGFFNTESGDAGGGDLSQEVISPGKKAKSSRSYLPQKNSVSYALLITLYRGIEKGAEYMHKQELIDAAEASGLARVPIAPEKGRGKLGNPGNSKREWYSGWSSMSKLVDKGLVVKTSCPAKYKLSDAGRQAAYDCLLRSDLLDSTSHLISKKELSDLETQDVDNLDYSSPELVEEAALTYVNFNSKDLRDNVSMDDLEKVTVRSDSAYASIRNSLEEDQQGAKSRRCSTDSGSPPSFEAFTSCLRPHSSFDDHKTRKFSLQANHNVVRMPPLGFLEKFEDTYEVVLILDDREHFVRSKSRNIIENVRDQYKIRIEVRRLPVGDGIWIARHRLNSSEYVLDYIVERKNVDDLRSSIRDNRYKDQKLRLLRTGLQKIIYMVEGDPNVCQATDSIKTACFTTEILEGFDVQRTSSLADTLKRYGYLTLAITDYYKLSSCEGEHSSSPCLKYEEFIHQCEDLDKMTVRDVFATQLMQVSQVTEEVAVAVLDCYPTLYSLACAYSLLDGDTRAQEELLLKRSKNMINSAASRNIFRLVWQN